MAGPYGGAFIAFPLGGRWHRASPASPMTDEGRRRADVGIGPYGGGGRAGEPGPYAGGRRADVGIGPYGDEGFGKREVGS